MRARAISNRYGVTSNTIGAFESPKPRADGFGHVWIRPGIGAAGRLVVPGRIGLQNRHETSARGQCAAAHF